MAFVEKFGSILHPIGDDLSPFLGFDAVVTLVLVLLVAMVILQNRRKHQSIVTEVENLIRRYIVFRGHRQALIKVHQGDEKTKHEMLRAISSSWNQFKSALENHSITLERTDRRTRNALYILGVIMVANSLREFASGILIDHIQWGDIIFVLRELPAYLFLATGFLLIIIQSRRWKKRPLTTFDGELDAIFSDTEKTQEALDNEFDPIEQSFPVEEPWPTRS